MHPAFLPSTAIIPNQQCLINVRDWTWEHNAKNCSFFCGLGSDRSRPHSATRALGLKGFKVRSCNEYECDMHAFGLLAMGQKIAGEVTDMNGAVVKAFTFNSVPGVFLICRLTQVTSSRKPAAFPHIAEWHLATNAIPTHCRTC